MNKKGYIYLITNKINGKQYVGQTARDIWTRFDEHCSNTHNSAIGNAINKYGYNNFTLQELEAVELNKLDERETYWVKYYNTFEKGYNQTKGGSTIREYEHLLVVEKDLVIDSVEEFGRLAEKQVGWSKSTLIRKIREVIDTDSTFLSYHFKKVPKEREVTNDEVVLDWIQTLQIRFNGKHIYCFELKQEFNTIAECAKYLLDNNLYITTSKTPLQSAVTAIGKQLHQTTNYIESVIGPLTFCYLPGTTKNLGSETPFAKQKVYCSQIDREFESLQEAAVYMIDNKIWQGIKLKTAKLRISNVVNGYFSDYRGYTFERR